MVNQNRTYVESLNESVKPIIDDVLYRLKTVYLKFPLAHESHRILWERFFDVIEKDPDKIKFYISQFPLVEQIPTLKIGIDSDEESGEDGFVLPITLDQALDLHSKITPADYRLLCKHATMNHIAFLQLHINRVLAGKNPRDLEESEKAFVKALIRDIKPLVELLNDLEKDDPNRNWLEIIQLYVV